MCKILKSIIKYVFSYSQIVNSDPSIDGDTPFKSCRSGNEIFCQEISNEPRSRVTNDIKQQLHYDTWREIEEIILIHEKGTASTFNRLNLYVIPAILAFHTLLQKL